MSHVNCLDTVSTSFGKLPLTFLLAPASGGRKEGQRTMEILSSRGRSNCFQLWIFLALVLLSDADAFLAPASASKCRQSIRRRSHHTVLLSKPGDGTADTTTIKPHVLVVGGGVGGLALVSRIAASLSPDCCRVTLLEKNDRVGGRMGSFDVKVDGMGTFRHEYGPSLLLLPQIYQDLFSDTGMGTAHDYGLDILQCVPAYQVVFDDGDRIDIGFPAGNEKTKLEHISRSKMDSFEPNGAEKWDRYMKVCEAFLDCGLPNFIEERLDLASFPAFLHAALEDWGKAWPLKPHSDVLDAMFESHKMRALASFQDLYVGLEPYRNDKLLAGGVLDTTAPAVFGLLAAIELHPTNDKAGVFAPVGGFRSVAQSMEKLASDLGVCIKCGCTVTNVSSDGVYYIDTESSSEKPIFESADFVIVNADLPYATESLLRGERSSLPSYTYDWDTNYRFSCGVLAFHWSIRSTLDDLNTHNVFMSTKSRNDAETSWKVLRDNDQSSIPFSASSHDPFNFYVHRAGKTDPSAAPKGMDTLLVLVPCPHLTRDKSNAALSREEAILAYRNQFGESFISNVRNSIFERMSVIDSLKDLKTLVVHELVDAPPTYAELYNVGAGTPFALSHGLAQLSWARPGPFSSGLSNVYFCGASSRPGNGVPLVLTGAKLVADKVASRINKIFPQR